MISIETGGLELILGFMLGAVLGVTNDMGQMIYLTPQSYAARLQMLSNVLDLLLDDEPTELTPLFKRAARLTERAQAAIGKRHAHIHDTWGVSKEDRSKVMRRPAPFRKAKPHKEVKVETLEAEIRTLRELADEIQELAVAIRLKHAALLQASLEKYA